ncbi:hypothetical protein BGP_6623 [Beggiatoa sp. PS]|nr:hypothetical protein BGP_6623 [Beggiatoa sp. PS]
MGKILLTGLLRSRYSAISPNKLAIQRMGHRVRCSTSTALVQYFNIKLITKFFKITYRT